MNLTIKTQNKTKKPNPNERNDDNDGTIALARARQFIRRSEQSRSRMRRVASTHILNAVKYVKQQMPIIWTKTETMQLHFLLKVRTKNRRVQCMAL